MLCDCQSTACIVGRAPGDDWCDVEARGIASLDLRLQETGNKEMEDCDKVNSDSGQESLTATVQDITLGTVRGPGDVIASCSNRRCQCQALPDSGRPLLTDRLALLALAAVPWPYTIRPAHNGYGIGAQWSVRLDRCLWFVRCCPVMLLAAVWFERYAWRFDDGSP
jgi:hypothetical protein